MSQDSQRRFLHKFWTAFEGRAQMTALGPKLGKPPTSKHYYRFRVDPETRGFNVSMVILRSRMEAECQLVIDSNAWEPITVLESLQGEQDAIERELGPLYWEPKPEVRRCMISQRRDADFDEPSNWSEIADWLLERGEAFDSTFGPYIRSLNLRA